MRVLIPNRMDASLPNTELSELRDLIVSLQKENQLLRQKLDAFIKRYFGGKKNEAIDPAQLEMLLAGLTSAVVSTPAAAADKPLAPRSDRKKAVRQPLPNHLPVEEVVIEPDEVKQDPESWKMIDQEVTEELDYKPAQFIKRLYIRPKYVRRASVAVAAHPVDDALADIYGRSEPAVIIGPLPSRLIEKGLPGPGLLAHVVISKYEDHLPLYRQEKIYRERHGVKISRASLAEWVEQVAFWLKPIYEQMKQSLLRGSYIQADETPIRYLDPDLPGKSRQGYLWAYSRPQAEVVFEWRTDRNRMGLEEFLKPFKGLLQSDGYAAYRSLAKDRPNELEHLGCWAHARRKFHEALEDDRRAGWFIRQIGHLYELEKRLRQSRAGPQLREAARAAEAQLVLNRIEKALRLVKVKVLPQSRLGLAIHYTLEQWTELSRYVKHGRAEIDTNLVENSIRPTAVGKKNFLFIGHPDAGWRSAVIYSVLGSCRRYGIDPHEYLNDVLRRLPDMKQSQIAEITPAAWAQAKKAARKPAA